MKILGIIPSRYGSTRFPGKPLALLGGKPVVQWVYEKSASVIETVCVATDDERIFNCVKDFGGRVVMTSKAHPSGTDRCAEALEIMEVLSKQQFDIVINIQGDEPFIDTMQINQLVGLFEDPQTQIGTLAKEISDRLDIFDPNKPKLVKDTNDFALLFSRSPIPYIRGMKMEEWPGDHKFLKHIGIYAYLSKVLRTLTLLTPSELEIAESLEQLRWLENGYRIKIGLTQIESIGIDTPGDLEKAQGLIGK
jgi:3-deoxy-manno-octulosonate cytidylyltransferase (CMP-KDO synthetase)